MPHRTPYTSCQLALAKTNSTNLVAAYCHVGLVWWVHPIAKACLEVRTGALERRTEGVLQHNSKEAHRVQSLLADTACIPHAQHNKEVPCWPQPCGIAQPMPRHRQSDLPQGETSHIWLDNGLLSVPSYAGLPPLGHPGFQPPSREPAAGLMAPRVDLTVWFIGGLGFGVKL